MFHEYVYVHFVIVDALSTTPNNPHNRRPITCPTMYGAPLVRGIVATSNLFLPSDDATTLTASANRCYDVITYTPAPHCASVLVSTDAAFIHILYYVQYTDPHNLTYACVCVCMRRHSYILATLCFIH